MTACSGRMGAAASNRNHMQYEVRRKFFGCGKKKHVAAAIPCTVLFIVCLSSLIPAAKGYAVCIPLSFQALVPGLFGAVYSAGRMEAYELPVQNGQYSSGLWFKRKRKIRDRIDRLSTGTPAKPAFLTAGTARLRPPPHKAARPFPQGRGRCFQQISSSCGKPQTPPLTAARCDARCCGAHR